MILIYVKVAEWPSFRKELTTRSFVRSLCNLYICMFLVIFPFQFLGLYADTEMSSKDWF